MQQADRKREKVNKFHETAIQHIKLTWLEQEKNKVKSCYTAPKFKCKANVSLLYFPTVYESNNKIDQNQQFLYPEDKNFCS